MNTLRAMLDDVRRAVVNDERVRALSEQVDAMDARLADARERIVRLETIVSMLNPPAVWRNPGPGR